MLEIDGTEGGGQILRTSLSLAAIQGKSFTITNIRGKRSTPGLQAQHLACVLAVQRITNARIDGAVIGSTKLTYYHEDVTPVNDDASRIRRPRYPSLQDAVFEIGTSGSAMLVLQTILPILWFACEGQSTFAITGGTHNALAPSSTFIEKTFLPVLRKLGLNADLVTERVGLMPEGRGRVKVVVDPAVSVTSLKSFSLAGGPKKLKDATIFYKNVVADDFRKLLKEATRVGTANEVFCGQAKKSSYAVCLQIESPEVNMIITASDYKNNVKNTIDIAQTELDKYMKSDCVVDEYLSDQLLLYVALSCDVAYRVDELSEHFRTNLAVIEKFRGSVVDVSTDFVVSRIAVL